MLHLNEKFSATIKLQVWNKAKIVGNNDPKIWRQDFAGAWIKYDDYGKCTSETSYGWEIDHIKPQSKGGSDNLSNLQPMQWCNNRIKGDNYPNFKTSISSNDTKNVHKEQSWKINL